MYPTILVEYMNESESKTWKTIPVMNRANELIFPLLKPRSKGE